MTKQQTIRRLYKQFLPMLERDYPRMDVYICDWVAMMTPIEENVWSDIRVLGLPFLPQFPVAGYFIDFADPIKKIGIEVDGHTMGRDYARDSKRQEALERLGWKIIRIPGRFTFTDKENYYDYDEDDRMIVKPEFYYSCSEGILTLLKRQRYDN